MSNVRSIESARAPKHTADISTMPSAPQIEAGFLFAMLSPPLRTPDLIAALRLLTPEQFFVPQNARAHQAMLEIDEDGGTVDALAVCERLRGVPAPAVGWLKYLTETIAIEGAHADAPPSEYAAILLEKWRLRETIRVCGETIAKARNHEDSGDVSDSAREALTVVAESRADATEMPAATTFDVVQDVWTTIEAATSGKPQGVSWGFDVVDERLGRLQQPSYVIIGGRSGQGKTQLAWQAGLNMGLRAKDHDTGMLEGMYYGSFEMAKKALMLRGVCIEANVPTKFVTSGRIPRESNPRLDGADCPTCGAEYKFDTWDSLPTNARNEKVCRVCAARERSVDAAPCPVPAASPFDRLVQASGTISRAPIFIDEKPCTPRVLAERFKRVRDTAAEGKMLTRTGAHYPPTLIRNIVIDSIQNMPAPPGASNRSRQVELQAVSRSVLNDVAKACNVAVIGLVQLNRGIDGQKERRPQLKDIREAGDIEYDADEIAFVHREQYYMRENTPPELRNIADIVHGKGRSGLDLESPPARLWFSGGMFFDGPPSGWQAWEEKHGSGAR